MENNSEIDLKCSECGNDFKHERSLKRHRDQGRCPKLAKRIKRNPIVLTPKENYENVLRELRCCEFYK